MKRALVLLGFMIVAVFSYSQEGIEMDIFGDLKYSSPSGDYTAALKKNIFDDLTFSDNNNNKVVYEKKYLDYKYNGQVKQYDDKLFFFLMLIHRFKVEKNYEAKYTIDIFGKVDITESRTIYGSSDNQHEAQLSVHRTFDGIYVYEYANKRATLTKDSFGNRYYSDNMGNSVKIDYNTFPVLVSKHGNAENVLRFFVNTFMEY